MAYFQYQRKKNHSKRIFLSVGLFLAIFALFFGGIHSFSESSSERQKDNLENALNRSITYCYATEGSYPESLSYIKEHYGLNYDENRFFVDYKIIGSNIFPDVTIIEKGDQK